MSEKLTWEGIVPFIPETTYLSYVDYGDNLDNHKDKIQKCIQEKSYSPLDEMIFDHYLNGEADSVDSYYRGIYIEVKKEYGVEKTDQAFEEFGETVEEELYNRDRSTPLQDLMRNTGEIIFFYDLRLETGTYYNSSDEERRQALKEIKKCLNIPIKDKDSDKLIQELIDNAYGGGNLEIYFRANIDTIIDAVIKGKNTIKFSGYNLAKVDHVEGSGYNVYVDRKLSLPFDNTRLFVEGQIGYSYTNEICGLYSDWCKDTEFEIINTARRVKLQEPALSILNEIMEQEHKYQETYDKGGCTFGDIKLSRHRNITYINEFPCGTKCKNCGQFWVD